jgi:hypothetical protein
VVCGLLLFSDRNFLENIFDNIITVSYYLNE